MKRTLAALLVALALAACGEVAETTDSTTAAEITEVVTAAETTTQTTAETTTEEITAAETTAVITTEETTAEITTEATTAATTVATTTAAATTAVTTTEATTAEATTEEITTTVEETTASAAPEIFSFEESDLADYILLGKYLGIEVHVPAPDPVSDEEVEEEIDKVIETLPAEAMLYTRACVEGDKVNINFVGTIDGVPFDGGSGENITLVLGEGKFVPGFEEGILGMLPGDVFPVNVVFPEDYYEEYASKAAEFEITLNYIYPKLTDAIAAEYFGYENAEAVRADVRASLESDAYSALDSEKEKAAWTKVLANSSVVIYPEEKLSAAFEAQVNMYKELAASYNMTYEELFTAGYGISVDEAEEILFEGAKNSVKQQLVLYSIARAEGAPIDDAAYEADMLALAEGYGLASVDELLAAIGYTKSELKEIIIYTGIISKIIENANFVEISK